MQNVSCYSMQKIVLSCTDLKPVAEFLQNKLPLGKLRLPNCGNPREPHGDLVVKEA